MSRIHFFLENDMKTTICTILRQVAILVLLVFAFSSAYSQTKTFEIVGSRNISFSAPSPMYQSTRVIVKNLIGSARTLSVTTEGQSSTYEIYNTNFVQLNDTLGFIGGEISISYKGGNALPADMRIILADGTLWSDTLFVHGEDSRFSDADHPYRISFGGKYTTNTMTVIEDITDQNQRAYTITVGNFTSEELQMEAFASGSTGFEIKESSFIIPPSSTSVSNHILTVNYTRTGKPENQGYVVLRNINLKTCIDTVHYIIVDSSLLTKPYLLCDSVHFIEQAMGTKECKEFVIRNPNTFDVTITKAPVYAKNPNHFTAEELKVPTTISAGGELRLDICYTAPNEHNLYSIYDIEIEFENPAGVKGYYQYPTAFGSTPNCYTAQPNRSLLIPATIPGGYTERDFTFVNQLGEPIVISKLEMTGPDASEFSLINLPSTPLSIPAFGTKEFTVRYAPKPRNGYSGAAVSMTLEGTSDKNCSEFAYGVIGLIRFESDSEYYPLFGDLKETLPIKSGQDKITKEFIFYNNNATAVKVLSVSVTDGTHFRIMSTDPSALPVTIAPGGQLAVMVEFDAGSGGIYNDELVIVTDNALTSLTFQMQGIRATTASVSGVSIGAPELSILPNPTASSVRIATTNAVIRETAIYDILGNVVARAANTNNWTWDLRSSSGERVADGAYFVRTEGMHNGSVFVKTEKMIVRK
jgi:hypothetical protein